MLLTANTIKALEYLVRLINIFILVRVVFSWINPNPYSAIVQFIYSVTEPILSPVRKLIYGLGYNGMFDFSPIIAIALVNMAFTFLVKIIIGFSYL